MPTESSREPRHRPEHPTGWWAQVRYLLGRTLHEVGRDELIDEAAALTYYGLFSVFPAILALVGIVGLVASRADALDALSGMFDAVGGVSFAGVLREPLDHLGHSGGGGWALALGLIGAIWGASGFVSAFGRSLNRMTGVLEGRGAVRIIIVQLVTTLAVLALAVIIALCLIAGTSVVQSLAAPLGVSSAAVTAWTWIRPLLIATLMVVLIGLMYSSSANIRRRVFSWGGLVALLLWTVTTALASLYIATLAHFEATYGTLAAIIGLVLWLWLSNMSLLVGAEFDSELERLRRLKQGEDVESRLRPELKATEAIDRRTEQGALDILRARAIRTASRRDAAARRDASVDGR